MCSIISGGDLGLLSLPAIGVGLCKRPMQRMFGEAGRKFLKETKCGSRICSADACSKTAGFGHAIVNGAKYGGPRLQFSAEPNQPFWSMLYYRYFVSEMKNIPRSKRESRSSHRWLDDTSLLLREGEHLFCSKCQTRGPQLYDGLRQETCRMAAGEQQAITISGLPKDCWKMLKRWRNWYICKFVWYIDTRCTYTMLNNKHIKLTFGTSCPCWIPQRMSYGSSHASAPAQLRGRRAAVQNWLESMWREKTNEYTVVFFGGTLDL